jgi:hypothetical protein
VNPLNIKIPSKNMPEKPTHSEENSMETTAVVSVQTATGTKYSDNLYSPCIYKTKKKCMV